VSLTVHRPHSAQHASILTIAYVTALLERWLEYGVVAADVGNVKISAVPPERIVPGQEHQLQLNLFLHQVTPNTRLRPHSSREKDAQACQHDRRGPLLDLHYLLTAYAEQELRTEVLLGYAADRMYEARDLRYNGTSWLPAGSAAGSTGVEPPALAMNVRSDRVSRLAGVTVEPQFLSGEELSRLWSALQARYRPSLAYKVSLVLADE
jgi:hypothetical protein